MMPNLTISYLYFVSNYLTSVTQTIQTEYSEKKFRVTAKNCQISHNIKTLSPNFKVTCAITMHKKRKYKNIYKTDTYKIFRFSNFDQIAQNGQIAKNRLAI
jgi:hypothetical protein